MNSNEKMSWLEKLSSGDASFDDVKSNLENEETPQQHSKKFLFIKIESSDGDKVNVKLPIGLGKFLLKKGKFMKNTSIADSDIDIEELLEMIDDGAIGDLVDIESHDGDRVKIFVK